MGNELVEFRFSNEILKVEQEVEPLLIWDARESVIGVLALQISDQLGEFVVGTKMFHGIRESLPADDG